MQVTRTGWATAAFTDLGALLAFRASDLAWQDAQLAAFGAGVLVLAGTAGAMRAGRRRGETLSIRPWTFLFVALLALFVRGGLVGWILPVAAPALLVGTTVAATWLVFRALAGLLHAGDGAPSPLAETRWVRILQGLIAYTILLRLVYLQPVELLHEEAYYWLYAQHLALRLPGPPAPRRVVDRADDGGVRAMRVRRAHRGLAALARNGGVRPRPDPTHLRSTHGLGRGIAPGIPAVLLRHRGGDDTRCATRVLLGGCSLLRLPGDPRGRPEGVPGLRAVPGSRASRQVHDRIPRTGRSPLPPGRPRIPGLAPAMADVGGDGVRPSRVLARPRVERAARLALLPLSGR